MRNDEIFKLSQRYIPGGVNSPVRAYLGLEAISTPPVIARGEGAYIYDVEGKKYLDLVQSYGPLLFGHAKAQIVEAITQAAKNGTSFGAPTKAELDLAQFMVENLPGIDQVRFVNSGTEASMSALRLARAFTKREGIVKFAGCYHGHCDALLVKAGSGLATSGLSSSAGVTAGAIKDSFVAVYNDIESVKKLLESKEIAAVIIEPVAGNMGFVPGETKFLQELAKECKKHGALLIFDEVMSGFRCAFTGSYALHGVLADIYIFGKVIGGGLPVGAYAAKEEIMSLLAPKGPVYQAGTLSGNPLAMAAGLASLKLAKAEFGLYERLEAAAKMFLSTWNEAAKEKGIEFCCEARGSMFGYFFTKKARNYEEAKKSDERAFKSFFASMQKQGIYMAPSVFETSFLNTAMSKDDFNLLANAGYEAIMGI